MFQKLVRDFYFRIEFSALFPQLETARTQHRDGRASAVDSLRDLYAKLAIFPFVYYGMKRTDDNVRTCVTQISSLPDGRMKYIYTKNSPVFVKLDQVIHARDTNDFNSLFSDLQLFLNEVFAALRPVPLPRTAKYVVRGITWLTVIAGLGLSAFYFTSRYRQERIEYEWLSLGDARFQKPVDDILRLQKALADYFEDHKSYPRSSGGWDARLAAFGESKEEWIPGLAPEYITALPEDPRQSDNPREQYMYISDGTDYKLISHNPENMRYIIDNYPQLVDPRRSTWAFGVWTENAKDW